MIPLGLIIGIVVGVAAGAIFGVFTISSDDDEQLKFVLGPSLSIVTEKTDFKIGEEISIKVINSGTVPLSFSDASYGLKIINLDGGNIYSPISAQVISTLEPTQEVSFVWDQIKNNGEPLLEGLYKIETETKDDQGKTVKKTITINIRKWFFSKNNTLYNQIWWK